MDGKVALASVGARRLPAAVEQRSRREARTLRGARRPVIVALWAAARGRASAVLLPVLAVLAIVPDPARTGRRRTRCRRFSPRRPTGVVSGRREHPAPAGELERHRDLWQVGAGFRFTMAGGYVLEPHPPSSSTPPAVIVALGIKRAADEAGSRALHPRQARHDSRRRQEPGALWASALDTIAPRHDVGGVLVYRVGASRRTVPDPPRLRSPSMGRIELEQGDITAREGRCDRERGESVSFSAAAESTVRSTVPAAPTILAECRTLGGCDLGGGESDRCRGSCRPLRDPHGRGPSLAGRFQ